MVSRRLEDCLVETDIGVDEIVRTVLIANHVSIRGQCTDTQSKLTMKHRPRSRNRPASVLMNGSIAQKSIKIP